MAHFLSVVTIDESQITHAGGSGMSSRQRDWFIGPISAGDTCDCTRYSLAYFDDSILVAMLSIVWCMIDMTIINGLIRMTLSPVEYAQADALFALGFFLTSTVRSMPCHVPLDSLVRHYHCCLYSVFVAIYWLVKLHGDWWIYYNTKW